MKLEGLSIAVSYLISHNTAFGYFHGPLIFFGSWYVRKMALSTYSLGTRVSTTLQSRSRAGCGSSTYRTCMYKIQIRHTLVCWIPLLIANKIIWFIKKLFEGSSTPYFRDNSSCIYDHVKLLPNVIHGKVHPHCLVVALLE
jgi:hypothetical protein